MRTLTKSSHFIPPFPCLTSSGVFKRWCMLATALVDNFENQLFCATFCSSGSNMGFFLSKPSLDMMLRPMPPFVGSSSFEKIEAWSFLVFDLAFCGSRDDRYARADSPLVVAVSKTGNVVVEEIACLVLEARKEEAGVFLSAFPVVRETRGDITSGEAGGIGADAGGKGIWSADVILASLFFLDFFFFFFEGVLGFSSSVVSSAVASSVGGEAKRGKNQGWGRRHQSNSISTFLRPCLRWEFRWRMQFGVSLKKTP